MMMIIMIIIMMVVMIIMIATTFLLLAPQNCAFNGCGDFEFDKLGVDRDESIGKRSDLAAKTMCNRWRRRRGFQNRSYHHHTYNID